MSCYHKLVHLTSVHARYDTRIFIKECHSLANNGFYVSLVVADNMGDETKDDINIYDVGKCSGRINRMLKTTKKVYQKALELDADIYHLHDPELIPIGLKLLKKGKKVIFDAHEDLPKQILSKSYLKPWQAKVITKICKWYEKHSLLKFTGVVTATPHIENKFNQINSSVVNINNYPILGELGDIKEPADWSKKKNQVCYIGGLSTVRGIKEIVQSMGHTQSVTHLSIAGVFSESDFEKSIKLLSSWSSVNYLGFLNRPDIKQTLSDSICGLVTLHPTINYIEALPVKMFEYMSAGIPVIASNFPLWKKIVEGNKCGLCVDPLNPKEIAEAIDYLANNPKEAQKMGENGRQAILEEYNWSIEEEKLIKFYRELLV